MIREEIMKKILLAFGLFGAMAAHAADQLNGTVWQTIDDETKKPKAIVVFTEQKTVHCLQVFKKY
jgi:hypothetical protein